MRYNYRGSGSCLTNTQVLLWSSLSLLPPQSTYYMEGDTGHKVFHTQFGELHSTSYLNLWGQLPPPPWQAVLQSTSATADTIPSTGVPMDSTEPK